MKIPLLLLPTLEKCRTSDSTRVFDVQFGAFRVFLNLPVVFIPFVFLLSHRASGLCLESTGWGTSTFTSWPARGSTPCGWSWQTGTDCRPSRCTTASRSAARSKTTGKTVFRFGLLGPNRLMAFSGPRAHTGSFSYTWTVFFSLLSPHWF